ncbi:uncharacterized protein [Amphiura filiformis]|uniref:uncharacterized protein isoform X3 n=1 Tax=Amphiura filiformis TaxID=82378 RepID=UPI003B223FFE
MSKQSLQGGEVILDDWFIQMVPNGKGIRVQGHRSCDPPDSFWNSSVITRRIDRSTVTTKSGTVYKLISKMDRIAAREEGFNAKIVRKFYCGFPVNWKECLSEFLHEDRTLKPVNKRRSVAPGLLNKKLETPSLLTKKVETPKGGVTTPLTPVNEVLVRDLPRSSSGRMIKPPLAYWTNQRIRHNISTDTVEIIAGGTNYLPHNTSETQLTGSTELTPYAYNKLKRTLNREVKKSGSAPSRRKRPKLTKEDTSTDGEDDTSVASTAETDTDSTLPAVNQKQPLQKNMKLKRERTKSLQENAEKRRTRNSVEIVGVVESSISNVQADERSTSCKGNANKRRTRESVEVIGVKSCKENAEKRTRNSAEIVWVKPGKQDATKRMTRKSVEIVESSISKVQADRRKSKQNKVKLTEQSESENLDEAATQSDYELSRDPPAPPRKNKLKKVGSSVLPGTIKSPLYYASPDPTSDGDSSAQGIKLPVVGRTPSVSHPSVAALSGTNDDKDTPRTAHLKSDALEHDFAVQLSDVKKKMTVSKTLGSSPLDLQREIMSVVQSHKQRRVAERSSKRKSKRSESMIGLGDTDTDVYDLDNSTDDASEALSILPSLKTNLKEKKTVPKMKPPSTMSSANGTDSDSDFTRMVKSKANGEVNGASGVKTKSTNVGHAGSLRRSTRNRSSSAESLQRSQMKSSTGRENVRKSARNRSSSRESVRTTARNQSSSRESVRTAARNLSSSRESVRTAARNLSSSRESARNRSSSRDNVRTSARNRSSSRESVRTTARNQSSRRENVRDRSSSRESVRTSTRNRNRANYKESNSDTIPSSDCEDQERHASSKTNFGSEVGQKRRPRMNTKKTATVKTSEIITLDSESEDSFINEQDKHRYGKTKVGDCSTTKLPTRQSKQKAAENICLNNSESSGSEMVSLKTKTSAAHPNRTVLKAKRTAQSAKSKLQSDKVIDSTDDDALRPASRRGRRQTRKSAQDGPAPKEVNPRNASAERRKAGAEAQSGNTAEAEDPSGMNEISPSTEKENATTHRTHGTFEKSEMDWSPVELAKLKRALEVVKPDTAMYWQCVASIVRTKSAHLCQQKHQESLENQMNHKATSKKMDDGNKQTNKVNTEPVKLTAKRGTMKRKRQLRDLVEQHNQGHEADYFDSTPFKIQNKRIKISAAMDSDDEDEGSGSFQTPGMARFKTPGSVRFKTPSVRPWQVAPLSDKKTPHTNLLSPLVAANVERKHIDTYISGIQKKKKGRTLLPAQSTPMRKKQMTKTKSDMSMEQAVNQANAAGLFEARPASDGSDSDEPSDYYWSEGEQD